MIPYAPFYLYRNRTVRIIEQPVNDLCVVVVIGDPDQRYCCKASELIELPSSERTPITTIFKGGGWEQVED